MSNKPNLILSEDYFHFPIRIYHPAARAAKDKEFFNIMNNEGSITEEDMEVLKSEIAWVIGEMVCHVDDIVRWYDDIDSTQEVEDVGKKGFKYTGVVLKDGREAFCVWNRLKFENKRDAHIMKLRNNSA